MVSREQLRIRREKVKVFVIEGLSIQEIADELGVSYDSIRTDIYRIKDDALLHRDEKVAELAFLDYKATVEESIEKAEEMGSLDSLRFICDKKLGLLTLAQNLGMLDKAVEKKEVNLVMEISPDDVKNYGNWLASKEK